MPFVDAGTPPSAPRGYYHEIIPITSNTTLTENHRDRVLQVNSGSGVTLTLARDLPVGFHCKIEQYGAGAVTLSAASGATLVGGGGATGPSGQYAIVDLAVSANVGGYGAVYNMTGQSASAAELSLLDNVMATATIALAAGAANVMTVTITVKDAAAATIAAVHRLDMWVSEAATGIGLTADTISGDLTVGTGSELQEIVSKKHYTLLTAATGIIVLSIEDTAKPADQYIVVANPLSGKLIVSAASGVNWG